MEEISFVLGKFGWTTRFSDLTEEQVKVLIFAVQESEKIKEQENEQQLEENYYKFTGCWPPSSIPF
jgi:hypothetical protein